MQLIFAVAVGVLGLEAVFAHELLCICFTTGLYLSQDV